MRSLKFHSVKAKNILCFGPEGIDIKFSDYGNVVLLKGINLDAPSSDGYDASNGAGKSSIQEIISIGLFGKNIKKQEGKKTEIINILADKGEVEVIWDDYRIVRTYSRTRTGVTSKVQLWQSTDHIWNDETNCDLTRDGLNEKVQEAIGLSHHSFCNVVVLDDSNIYSFLESDAAKKREIIENLLDLEQYRGFHENAKKLLKSYKGDVELFAREYSQLQEQVASCDRRTITVRQQEINWRVSKEKELEETKNKIKLKQSMLQSTNNGEELIKWQKAQDEIVELTNSNAEQEKNQEAISKLSIEIKDKLNTLSSERQLINQSIQSHNHELKNIQSDYDRALEMISKLENLTEGNTCPVCRGIINPQNYSDVISHGQETIKKCENVISKINNEIVAERQLFGQKSAMISKIEEKIKELDQKFSKGNSLIRNNKLRVVELSKINKPQADLFEKILESEISELKLQFVSKSEELNHSPYKEIIEEALLEKQQKESEKDSKQKQLEEAEAELPYYEFWVEAFGDNGIRKFVIDGIIEPFNERVAYWLQILVDNLIDVKFNNKFEETITRKQNPASYCNMSKGEIRKINLSVSQSFGYIMMVSCGTCPNIVFLDEITGGSIDRAGINFVYNMINELAKERQVFVTTHNEALMTLLQGCDTIKLKKENDITTIVP